MTFCSQLSRRFGNLLHRTGLREGAGSAGAFIALVLAGGAGAAAQRAGGRGGGSR